MVLLNGHIAELTINTLALMLGVAIVATVLGVSLAWLTWRFRFRGVVLLRALLLLPLIIPPYVLANVYSSLEVWLGINLHNYWGALLVLSISGYPYIMLLVLKSLHRTPSSYEEAANLAGASPLRTFFRVVLPMLRPAIAAGVVLVALHVIADFGAVSLLTYQTFTVVIYQALELVQDNSYIAALSVVPVLLGLLLLFFHDRVLLNKHITPTHIVTRPLPRRLPVLLAVLGTLVLGVAVIAPVAWMVYWTVVHFAELGQSNFLTLLRNSFALSAIVAVLAGSMAIAVAWVVWRWQGVSSRWLGYISTVSFALPGPVLALGIAVLVSYWDSFLTGQQATWGYLAFTGTALVLALVMRFIPVSVQAQASGLQSLNPQMLDAAASLGANSFQQFWRVILPAVWPNVLAAMVLVFIETVKELPVTMLLRPSGFDTLPIAIWIETDDERVDLAAPASLVLLLVSLPALFKASKESNSGNKKASK